MVTTLCHFGGRSPLKKSSTPNLNPISFTRSRLWNGNKIIYKHFVPWSNYSNNYIFHRILPEQNAGMHSDIFCLWHCECYGHLRGPTIHVASRQAWRSLGILFMRTIPCHLFNIYFMKQWCLTKIQNDDCVSLCSLLSDSYPTNFTKSLSAATPEIVSHFFLNSQGVNIFIINTAICIVLK